jgi:predicted Holliday junction resolvase-like endonuclease
MASISHRKQIVLFLLAVIVPSLVLVLFTLRMVRQEKELAKRQVVEERRQKAVEIGGHILLRLEKIKIDESSEGETEHGRISGFGYRNPEVVFVGLLLDERLVPPWELNPDRQKSRELLNEASFAERTRLAVCI